LFFLSVRLLEERTFSMLSQEVSRIYSEEVFSLMFEIGIAVIIFSSKNSVCGTKVTLGKC